MIRLLGPNRSSMPYLRLCGAALVLMMFQRCASADETPRAAHHALIDVDPVSLSADAPFASVLSSYHLFRDPRRQIPNAGVVPYEVNTPHFADYAKLRRFVWMPAGTSCHYGPRGDLEYPVGTAIILTVGYAHDVRDPDAGETLIETRLWLLRAAGWDGAQYLWKEDASDAILAVTGARVNVRWIDHEAINRQHTFRVPNRNQCKLCHDIAGRTVPLGPLHARYLNRTVLYDTGEHHQLEHWERIGYLSGLPAKHERIPRVPAWDDPESGDLDSRARAYLDMNCSSCHRPGGIAMTSGLDLRYEQEQPVRYGVFKAPVAAGRAAGNGRFVIEPGQPDRSILLLRLQSTDPGVRMPIVGRDITHAEGVELIRQWIATMEHPELEARQRQLDQRAERNRAWGARQLFPPDPTGPRSHP